MVWLGRLMGTEKENQGKPINLLALGFGAAKMTKLASTALALG